MNAEMPPASAVNSPSAPAAPVAAQAPVLPTSVIELVAQIRTPDDQVRGPAWQSAGRFGTNAVTALVEVMGDPAFETARCARRALWRIVRDVGRPGYEAQRAATEKRLLSSFPVASRLGQRELVWMLSEIGGAESVSVLETLLLQEELREDTRCALIRIPGDLSLASLRRGFAAAGGEFKFALADALRARGVEVTGFESKKRVPSHAPRAMQA